MSFEERNKVLDNLSDENVLKSASEGDVEAFGILYERYVKMIYTYVYYRTGNSFDAEDLTEQVFIRAMKHIKKYKHRGLPFTAWLYKIAHNLVANWYRDRSRKKEILLIENFNNPDNEPLPEQRIMVDEERGKLLKYIRRLPGERQELLILKFTENLTNSEIGLILGRTEGAIKSLYHRTLISLREMMIN